MSAENTAGKQRGRPFQTGQSGNPGGRPKGSRNATTLALETLLDGQATALTQKAIDLATNLFKKARTRVGTGELNRTLERIRDRHLPSLRGGKPPKIFYATQVGTGQMASCVRLGLRFDGETDTPASIVAKIPAIDVASRRDTRGLPAPRWAIQNG